MVKRMVIGDYLSMLRQHVHKRAEPLRRFEQIEFAHERRVEKLAGEIV